MSRNVYFSQGVQSEKNLYEDIIIESIKIYGHEVFYMPRKIIQVDEILNEDVASRFDSAFNIEMYVENVDGYEGDGILMSKFGLEIRNQMKLVVSRKRWDASVGVWNAGYNNFRPSEGDLIYMPTVKGVFEIKFVELETPFYQLQNLPVYKITCELFEYSNEDIDTGVAEVDAIQTNRSQDQSGGYRATFTYNGLRAAMSNADNVFIGGRYLRLANINGLFVGMGISCSALNINSYVTLINAPSGNTQYYSVLLPIQDAFKAGYLPAIGTGFNFHYRLQGMQNLTYSLTNVVIITSGAGYAVNDILTLSGGTNTIAATFTVTAVQSEGGQSGIVTAVAFIQGGVYTVIPASPGNTTVTRNGNTIIPGIICRLSTSGIWSGSYKSVLNLHNSTGLKVGMRASIIAKVITLASLTSAGGIVTGVTFARNSVTISCPGFSVIIPAGSSIVAVGIPIGAVTTGDKVSTDTSFTISIPTTAASIGSPTVTSPIAATVYIQRWKLDNDAKIIAITPQSSTITGTSTASAAYDGRVYVAGVGVTITSAAPLPTGYNGFNVGSRVTGNNLNGTCIIIGIDNSTTIRLSNTEACAANTTAVTFTIVTDIVTVDSGISAKNSTYPIIPANDTDVIAINFTSGFVLGESVSLTYPNNQTILPTTALTAFTYPNTAAGTAEISDATAIDTLSDDNSIMTLSTLSFNDGVIHPLTRGVIVTSLQSNMSAILNSVLTLVNDEDIADGDISSQNSVLEIKGNDYLDFTEINPFGEPNDS